MGMDRVGAKQVATLETKSGYETFEHGADIGIRGYGESLEEAFSNAAMAMFSIMVSDLNSIRPERSVEIQCESFDLTGLLVAYLNQLLAESDINGLVFCRFSPQIDAERFVIRDAPKGGPIPHGGEALGVEVKGATFTLADVRKEGDRFYAQCVVDV